MVRWMFGEEIVGRPGADPAQEPATAASCRTRCSCSWRWPSGVAGRRGDLGQHPVRLRHPRRGRRRGRHGRARRRSARSRSGRAGGVATPVPADWRERFVARLRRRVPGVGRRDRRRRPAGRPERLGRLRRGGGLRRGLEALRTGARVAVVAGREARSSTARGGAGVKIALDPYMLRKVPLLELPRLVADLGYRYIELSPREDFMPFFLHPRADRARCRRVQAGALDAAGVEVASVLPLYRWSGPDEDERQAAVRYWKRAIEITVDLGVTGDELRVQRPARAGAAAARPSSGGRWRSCCRSSSGRAYAWCWSRTRTTSSRTASAAVDMVRGHQLRPGHLPVLRAAHVPPGRRPGRGDARRRAAADPAARRRLVRPPRLVAGCATSSTRRARPPGSTSTWTSARARWTGTCSSAPWPRWASTASTTVCVFAWEERAEDSARVNLARVNEYVAQVRRLTFCVSGR